MKFFDLGIDLGTTNSAAAIPTDDGYEIIGNQTDSMTVTPSAVTINGKGRMHIGKRAYNTQNVSDLAIQFKRQMGTDKVFEFASAGISKTPEELSSEILKRLKSDVEQRLGTSVEHVVITVPAAFTSLQTEATNRAGKLAGFKQIILLQEPIAASVAYGVKPGAKDHNWMVFDYGGGTLDVAIVSTNDGRLEVINSEGDNYFGGSDIDKLMYRNIVVPAMKTAGYKLEGILDESTNEGRLNARRIRLECERAKIELSYKDSSIIEIFDIDDDEDEPIEFEYEITRDEYNSVIRDTIEKSIVIAENALKGSGLSSKDIDKILLVGGSTFIPLVREMLKERFDTELDVSIDPMTVVAAGAAIYASSNYVDESVEEETETQQETLVGAEQTSVAPETDDVNQPVRYVHANLVYDPSTSEEHTELVIAIPEAMDAGIDKVRIDCSDSEDFSGVVWTSGWLGFMNKARGLIITDVAVRRRKLNRYRLFACDANGSEIPIDPKDANFSIRHNDNNLKTSNPPATMSVGVKVADERTGKDTMDILIRRNTPLPVSADRTYRTTRELDPAHPDAIIIEIYEGENKDNPTANHQAGKIVIASTAMKHTIPAGTDIEITVTLDINRNIVVNGYIPDIDYEIPKETLRPDSRDNVSERFANAGKSIAEGRKRVDELKNKGVDTNQLEKKLDQLDQQFHNENVNQFDDADTNSFLKELNDVETEISVEEKNSAVACSNQKLLDDHSFYMDNIRQIGDQPDIEIAEQISAQFKRADNDKDRQYYINQLSDMHWNLLINNFGWLRWKFENDLSIADNFKDRLKAERLKQQAYDAIQCGDKDKLKFAVLGLFDIRIYDNQSSTSNENVYTSDIRM